MTSDEFVLSSSAPKELTSPTSGMRYGSSLDGWRKEIAQYYAVMKVMVDLDPTTVFQHLSQFSARASEMRSMIPSLKETREQASFRLRIIDPFIEECDRQFKIHSRIQAIREMDARLAGGSFA